jgi:hypothetical protein
MLFPTHNLDGGVDTQQGRQYDVAANGRFLITTELPGDAGPITLIQHWNPDAKP